MASGSTNTCGQLPRAEAIAQLNDQLRRNARGGSIIISRQSWACRNAACQP